MLWAARTVPYRILGTFRGEGKPAATVARAAGSTEPLLTSFRSGLHVSEVLIEFRFGDSADRPHRHLAAPIDD